MMLSESVGGRSPGVERSIAAEPWQVGSRSWPCRTMKAPSDHSSPAWMPRRAATTPSSLIQPSRSPASMKTLRAAVCMPRADGRPCKPVAGTGIPLPIHRRRVRTTRRLACRPASAARIRASCPLRPPCQGRSRPAQMSVASQLNVSPAKTRQTSVTGWYRPARDQPARIAARWITPSQASAAAAREAASDPSVISQFAVTASMSPLKTSSANRSPPLAGDAESYP